MSPHYSKGQYGHEPIIDPLHFALYRSWQHFERVAEAERIVAEAKERVERGSWRGVREALRHTNAGEVAR